MEPLVSFVTVSYKAPQLLRELLGSVAEAELQVPFEYFVVDNDSRDGTLDMIRSEFPWVRLIASPNNDGFGAGNNLAFREVKGKYVVLLNHDLRVAAGELERWLEWMESRPEVGVSGPRVMNLDGTDQHSCYRFYRWLTPLYRRTMLGRTPWGQKDLQAFVMTGMDREREQEVDWILGAAMCIRKEVLDRIGHFDERFFMYFEDVDLCYRAWKAGIKVAYTPVAKLEHRHGLASRTRYAWQAFSNPLTRVHILSGLKFFLKHAGAPDPRHERLI